MSSTLPNAPASPSVAAFSLPSSAGAGREQYVERTYCQLQRYARDLQETLRERELAYRQLYAFVTDLKQALAQRNRALAEARAAARAKSRLLANMSHEFRTPLTAILGFAELLCGRTEHASERDLLTRILGAGMRIEALVENLLTLARIEAHVMPISPQPCNVADILREESPRFAERARARGLTFDVSMPGFEVEPIAIDEARLRQALAALLDNAVKFTSQGGVSLTLHADPESHLPLRIDVADSGIGISAEDQVRVLDSFEQVDGSDTRAYEGAGLGLTVARALLELVGCRLEMQSDPGHGSTFSILLPHTLDPLNDLGR